MITKEVLLGQFNACYNEDNRFVAVEGALANLTAEQADWKTGNLDNPIRDF